jgi:hypothetical protein
MKTKEEVEAFLADVKSACAKHGMFLRGVSSSEGILAEILVCDKDGIDSCGWTSPSPFESVLPQEELTTTNEFDGWYIDGIK